MFNGIKEFMHFIKNKERRYFYLEIDSVSNHCIIHVKDFHLIFSSELSIFKDKEFKLTI